MATPLQILIIRHGEKPGDPSVDSDAGPELSPRGQARAAAIAHLLPLAFTPPDFIFATAASDASNRPVLTVSPLASALGLTIDCRFKNDEFPLLVQALQDPKYAGKRVLIGWHHGKIPALATALGVASPPSPWPNDVFDRVWQLDFDAQGAVTLTNLPQKTLFGDSAT